MEGKEQEDRKRSGLEAWESPPILASFHSSILPSFRLGANGRKTASLPSFQSSRLPFR